MNWDGLNPQFNFFLLKFGTFSDVDHEKNIFRVCRSKKIQKKVIILALVFLVNNISRYSKTNVLASTTTRQMYRVSLWPIHKSLQNCVATIHGFLYITTSIHRNIFSNFIHYIFKITLFCIKKYKKTDFYCFIS